MSNKICYYNPIEKIISSIKNNPQRFTCTLYKRFNIIIIIIIIIITFIMINK